MNLLEWPRSVTWAGTILSAVAPLAKCRRTIELEVLGRKHKLDVQGDEQEWNIRLGVDIKGRSVGHNNGLPIMPWERLMFPQLTIINARSPFSMDDCKEMMIASELAGSMCEDEEVETLQDMAQCALSTWD